MVKQIVIGFPAKVLKVGDIFWFLVHMEGSRVYWPDQNVPKSSEAALSALPS